MRAYGDDVLVLAAVGALMLGLVVVGRGIVIFASAIGWL